MSEAGGRSNDCIANFIFFYLSCTFVETENKADFDFDFDFIFNFMAVCGSGARGFWLLTER